MLWWSCGGQVLHNRTFVAWGRACCGSTDSASKRGLPPRATAAAKAVAVSAALAGPAAVAAAENGALSGFCFYARRRSPRRRPASQPVRKK